MNSTNNVVSIHKNDQQPRRPYFYTHDDFKRKSLARVKRMDVRVGDHIRMGLDQFATVLAVDLPHLKLKLENGNELDLVIWKYGFDMNLDTPWNGFPGPKNGGAR
jgi:hypothetical protein